MPARRGRTFLEPILAREEARRMQTITGIFETGQAARKAVGQLRDAGFPADDITLVLVRADGPCAPDAMEDAADTGRRLGALASDVAETAAAFVPVLGQNLVRSPMARAVRQAVEDAGESTGRLLGAASEGGLMAPRENSVGPDGRLASGVVRTSEHSVARAAAVLTNAGAVETEVARV
jgi:hypothetical protein